MMERLLARISQSDLHWLTSMETQELRALLDLIQTAKHKRLDLAVLSKSTIAISPAAEKWARN